jgi:hypothetical protein
MFQRSLGNHNRPGLRPENNLQGRRRRRKFQRSFLAEDTRAIFFALQRFGTPFPSSGPRSPPWIAEPFSAVGCMRKLALAMKPARAPISRSVGKTSFERRRWAGSRHATEASNHDCKKIKPTYCIEGTCSRRSNKACWENGPLWVCVAWGGATKPEGSSIWLDLICRKSHIPCLSDQGNTMRRARHFGASELVCPRPRGRR